MYRMQKYEGHGLLTRLRTHLLSPQRWLMAGVVCFGLAVAVGYHQDQMSANSVLARKAGLPPRVMIQDFKSALHTNIMDEMQILAEVDPEKVVEVNVGTASKPQWVNVAPVFAVSARSRPLAVQLLKQGQVRRPAPRSAVARMREDARALLPLVDRPIGVIVQETAGPQGAHPRISGLTPVGDGRNGDLVGIVGVRLADTSLLENAATALAGRGLTPVPDALAMSVYPNGRDAALAIKDLSPILNMLNTLSMLTVLVALALMLRAFAVKPGRRSEPSVQVKAVGAFPPYPGRTGHSQSR